MKKVLITALSLVMVGSVLLSAAGKKGGPKGGPKVQIVGEITAIVDTLALRTVTVDTDGDTVGETTVQVTVDTVVMKLKIDIGFSGLVSGDIVKVRGVWNDDVLVADKIIVKCVL